MLKKCWFTGLFFLVCSLIAEPLEVSVKAESAILINPDNGKILFEKNGFKPMHPASMTKLVTTAWALKLKRDKLNELVEASDESLKTISVETKKKADYQTPSWWLEPGASNIGLRKGEKMPLKDLLLGVMVSSAGDASNVVAEYCGGSISRFVDGMNAWVKAIGCKNSHFKNPHGLFHPEHKTTAYEMALMMKEALKDPYFVEILKQTKFTRPKTNLQKEQAMMVTNRLSRPGPYYYPKLIGGKTGYLSASQNTFVAAAKDKDRTLIAVFMKTKERTDIWKDTIALFEAAFQQKKIDKVFMKQGIQEFTLQEKSFDTPLYPFLSEDATLSYYPAEAPQVKALVFWDSLLPPIRKGEKVGQLQIVDETDKTLKAYTLYAANDVEPTLKYRIESFFFPESLPTLLFRWGLILGILLACYLIFK
ncbi:MAG: D-alanyl-D-alanine carboxypeptidase [Chlamydiia bacterium]|nr:D-alanyl-D-alanine carboxypeptidase [Chlamydiia bacterium]